MASLASLAHLGSLNMISFGNFDGSVCLIRSISIHRNGNSFSGRRWRYVGVCRYSVTTDYIAEQGTSLSLDSTYGDSKESDTNTFLKAAPKPVLKLGSKPNPLLNMSPDESKVSARSDAERLSDEEEERSKVIESLGEVLEKAEKLETSKKPDAPVSKPKPMTSEPVNQKNGKPFSSSENTNRKSNKTNKSVWRKGNPVSTVQKIVKETVRQEPRTDGGGVSSGSQPVAPVRPPPPPQKLQPKLQERPSVAPPSPPIKKPIILKDVGAGPKPLVSNGTDSPPKSKERKPILIDKFASKKQVVDPMIAQAVLAPSKPAKTFGPVKFKDGFRKKGGPSGTPRRRIDEDGIQDEDASELDVSIRGAATARKGRKWSKASRKAARLQAAKDAAPVRVEIMEVEEDGMSTEELAYNLATSEGEILGYLYSKGIKPDGVLKLSKDVVKMVCEEYDVEVIDADAISVEEMAKKKEVLDDDDLDKLELRPPVLTIMGHVDHGKVSNFCTPFSSVF